MKSVHGARDEGLESAEMPPPPWLTPSERHAYPLHPTPMQQGAAEGTVLETLCLASPSEL